MNLFLRLIWVALKARFRPKIGLLDECVTRFRAGFTDQDLFRHVTNSRYFSFTDVCVADYLMRSGASRVLRRRKWFPIIVYEDMIFRKMIRAPQRFQVHSQLLGWTEDAAVMRHVFVRRGEVTAEGLSFARFIAPRGKVIPPKDVLAALNHTGEAPPLPDYVQETLARAERGYLAGSPLEKDPSDASPPDA